MMNCESCLHDLDFRLLVGDEIFHAEKWLGRCDSQAASIIRNFRPPICVYELPPK